MALKGLMPEDQEDIAADSFIKGASLSYNTGKEEKKAEPVKQEKKRTKKVQFVLDVNDSATIDTLKNKANYLTEKSLDRSNLVTLAVKHLDSLSDEALAELAKKHFSE